MAFRNKKRPGLSLPQQSLSPPPSKRRKLTLKQNSVSKTITSQNITNSISNHSKFDSKFVALNLEYLKQSKYGIWIGCHESQGFALKKLNLVMYLYLFGVQQK